jgi:hypothetical protein
MAGFGPPCLAAGRVLVLVFSVYHSITVSSHSPNGIMTEGTSPSPAAGVKELQRRC